MRADIAAKRNAADKEEIPQVFAGLSLLSLGPEFSQDGQGTEIAKTARDPKGFTHEQVEQGNDETDGRATYIPRPRSGNPVDI